MNSRRQHPCVRRQRLALPAILYILASVAVPATALGRDRLRWNVPDLQFDLFRAAVGHPELRIDDSLLTVTINNPYGFDTVDDFSLMVAPVIWARPGSRVEDLTDEILEKLNRFLGDIPSHVRDEIRRKRGYRLADQ